MILNFGKHEGLDLKEVPDNYLAWLYKFVENKGQLNYEVSKEIKARSGDLADIDEHFDSEISSGRISSEGSVTPKGKNAYAEKKRLAEGKQIENTRRISMKSIQDLGGMYIPNFGFFDEEELDAMDNDGWE